MKRPSSKSDGTLSLFDQQAQMSRQTPLAELMRPQTLGDVLGQEKVLGPGTPLRNLAENRQLIPLIFWGVPGIGKTTLARILAQNSDASFIELSAVNSGLKELREAMAEAQETLRLSAKKTVVFIDEIHRYSKTQQDAILPYVENGTIVLMGATTENPSFQVAPALLSRLLVVRLEPLQRENIKTLIKKGVQFLGRSQGKISISLEGIGFIADYANGDARSALNLLETAYKCAPILSGSELKTSTENASLESTETLKTEPVRVIELSLLEGIAQQNRLNYDQHGDEHYDHASAYQKSMRGSDADAAVYWLAKMIAGGEDPRFIARRLVVTASEDVGLADPQALQIALAAAEAVERLGLPEGRIPLAQATIYVAKAPKDNAAISAIDEALQDILKNGHSYSPPPHLKDSHYKDAKSYGFGVGYVYSHDRPEVQQDFLPPELSGRKYVK